MTAADGVVTIEELVGRHGLGDEIDLVKAAAQRRFLPPITHPDPPDYISPAPA
jgi:hypothetical protein